MAFGADYIDECSYGGEFTKSNTEYYNALLEGYWYDCYDIRNPKWYGSYECVNKLPYKPEENIKESVENHDYNKFLCIESIKMLPDNTVFFFADSHW